MGCYHKTAKKSIQINEKCKTIATATTHLKNRITNCNNGTIQQCTHKSFQLNQLNTKDHINDDCQLQRVQQKQKPQIANPITKSDKTLTVCKIDDFNNINISGSSNTNNKVNSARKIKSIEYITGLNSIFLKETINLKQAKDDVGFPQAKPCINCYPLLCRHTFCLEQQKELHLVVDEITNCRGQNLKPSNYINDNNIANSSSGGSKNENCSKHTNIGNNNYCRCYLTHSSPKQAKNTLHNEKQGESHLCHCHRVTNEDKPFGTFADKHSATEHLLQKTISYAKTTLASNAIEFKNNLIEVMANCATIVESLAGIDTLFIKNYQNEDTVRKINKKSGNVKGNKINNIRHNKSESYRGYCPQKHRISHKSSFTSYTSSSISTSNTYITTKSKSSTSIPNSCFLHDAISSSTLRNNESHDINITTNTNICSNNNSNRRFMKNYGNNYNCHMATLNYIGQNYYNFLRNTINFYTASSFILVLCYLTSTTSAATTKSDVTSVDKHPILSIDWSKFDESSSDKEILDLLLEKKRYDKRLLPPVNGTLTVNVNVLLLSLASPDESSLKYEVEFLLNQQWNDPRLQYGNKSHYDFLNALHHHDSIWTPDTYFIMHGDFKDPIIPMHFALRIYRNGTITYAMRRHLILSCQGSLHIFPFDDPKCSFSMESISYEEAQIKYVWKNDEDTLRKSPSLTTLNAYLIKNQTTACDQNSWRGNYSCLRVDLIFTRDRAFYFTTVFIPGIILVTSSFITFWLEWNAVPARSMIGVTTMLNFFTTSNGFRSTLPVVSNLTAMNVWDGVCMCFIYASLLEFVCVNYMGRKRPQHNVVYRPGENPVTQEIIEREFHAALSSEKATAGLSSVGTSMRVTPGPGTPMTSEPVTQPHFYREKSGGIITAAVQNLRSRSIKKVSNLSKTDEIITKDVTHPLYEHVYTEPGGVTTFSAEPSNTNITIESDTGDHLVEQPKIRRTQSMSTNTPPLVCRSEINTNIYVDTKFNIKAKPIDVELPIKPPRKKSSRSTSPSVQEVALQREMAKELKIPATRNSGEKKRDAGGPNEIVACTTCGGSSGSPCTHSANNGCATETCFVQVRKKEPPHPIRIAKTIDVIARITFPTAYAIFLIFFFVHYKGFS